MRVFLPKQSAVLQDPDPPLVTRQRTEQPGGLRQPSDAGLGLMPGQLRADRHNFVPNRRRLDITENGGTRAKKLYGGQIVWFADGIRLDELHGER